MAKTRAKKETEVRAMAEGLKSAKAVVFADLSGVKVNALNDFRRAAGKEGVDVTQSKKTLLRLSLREAGVKGVDVDALMGSVSLLVGDDEVAPARTLEKFRKDNEKVKAIGGLIGETWMSAEQVKALASLPTKEQLIAQVVGTIRAPLSGLVGVLSGNIRNLVQVLSAIKDKKPA